MSSFVAIVTNYCGGLCGYYGKCNVSIPGSRPWWQSLFQQRSVHRLSFFCWLWNNILSGKWLIMFLSKLMLESSIYYTNDSSTINLFKVDCSMNPSQIINWLSDCVLHLMTLYLYLFNLQYLSFLPQLMPRKLGKPKYCLKWNFEMVPATLGHSTLAMCVIQPLRCQPRE